MAEIQGQNSPLIDPEKVKSVLKVTPVDVAGGSSSGIVKGKQKPTASQLGPKEYCWGTGRRKTAIARVRVRPGSGKIVVNKRELTAYFPVLQQQNDVLSALDATGVKARYDVWVDVKGGGATGQSGAAKLGLARALIQAEPELFGVLRDKGFLTRDSRMKERKKYGQKGARKRFQFSKR